MAQEDLQGCVALVTGGSGGIGRALVRRLAAAGCHVAVSYAGGAEAAGQAVSEATSLGVRAVALQADLADPGAARDLAVRATAALGPIDVLVPNAGVSIRTDLAGVDLDLWQRSLAVNLTAPFLLAQQLVPDMARRGFGRVLFVSSVALRSPEVSSAPTTQPPRPACTAWCTGWPRPTPHTEWRSTPSHPPS
jgi:3-oxoacyl-[acyl-carrier protein] reductase